MACDDTLGKRLAKARGETGMSQQAVADRVLDPSPDGSYRRQTIYEWEKDKYVPSGGDLEKLVRLYRGVSGHWLLTGEGDMYLPKGTEGARLNVIGRIVAGQLDDALVELASLPEAIPADVVAFVLAALKRREGRLPPTAGGPNEPDQP